MRWHNVPGAVDEYDPDVAFRVITDAFRSARDAQPTGKDAFILCIPGYPHLKIALRMLYGVSSLLFRLLIPTTANSAILRERMVLGFVGVGRNNLAQS